MMDLLNNKKNFECEYINMLNADLLTFTVVWLMTASVNTVLSQDYESVIISIRCLVFVLIGLF